MQYELRLNLDKRIKLSWLTVFFTSAILLFIAPMGIVFSLRSVIVFLAVMGGLNLLFTLFVKKNIFLELTAWLWPVSEVWLITLIVYYSGGFASIFSFLYLSPIIVTALLFSLNAGFGIAIFSSAAYLTLTILEIYGLIPHVSEIGMQILEWQDNTYIAFSVLLNRILIFFLVAYLGGFLANKQREVEKMKTEFVSMASHQLRTPATSIGLFTEALKKELKGKLSHKHEEYLDNIYNSNKRIIHLVDDFLSVSRIESGRLDPKLKLVYIDEIITSIINESRILSEIKQCHIVFDKYKNRLPKILTDPYLLRQVIYNLISNAIHYSPTGECDVKIELKKRNKKEYLISVEDIGIGISEDIKDRIFEKFFRADNAIKIDTQGTGIGLYIAKMIMNILGGKIWFESEYEIGTTFYISIPIKRGKLII